MIDVATSLVGRKCIRYIPGHPELGQSPESGFDCSGFVRYVLTVAGLALPDYLRVDGKTSQIRHTNEFFDYYGLAVQSSRKLPGDLIFFSSHGWGPTHMGIVKDFDHYIHAPGYDGQEVEESEIKLNNIEPNSSKRHRVIYDQNPIGYKSPITEHLESSYRVHQEAI